MKTYSLLFIALTVSLMGTSFLSLEPAHFVTTENHKSNAVKMNYNRNPWSSANFLTSLEGSYSGNGYHNYGSYSIDVSGLSANSVFSLNFSTYDVPNRFTLSNGTNNVFTGWHGTGNWPCQWGPNGISTSNTGSIFINKGTASTLSLIVESCNATPASLTDEWDVYY